MTLKSQNVELHPNSHMKKIIQQNCDYRRYCWNQALATWNDAYEIYQLDRKNNPLPNGNYVRNELVHNKADWQYQRSARILQLAVSDLKIAFNAFFDQKRIHAKHPNFCSRKRVKQSFKTDRAKIIDHKLRLDRPHGIDKSLFYDIRMTGLRSFNGQLKIVNIKHVNDRYIATLFYEDDENQVTSYTNRKTAIDLNVSHFNYTDGTLNVLPQKIQRLYQQNDFYQKLLSCKRTANPKTFRDSKQYQKILAKLQRNYRHITELQNDKFHKFTNMLVNNYDQIVIEDLNVDQMKMTHVASKGLQRNSFSKFRQLLTYKCQWYGKHLGLADRYYPSTQLCSQCGYRKINDDRITLQGNQKHHTKHQEYICYHCGAHLDRDDNAVLNLLKLIE